MKNRRNEIADLQTEKTRHISETGEAGKACAGKTWRTCIKEIERTGNNLGSLSKLEVY